MYVWERSTSSTCTFENGALAVRICLSVCVQCEVQVSAHVQQSFSQLALHWHPYFTHQQQTCRRVRFLLPCSFYNSMALFWQGPPNRGIERKNSDFRPIARFVSKMIGDTASYNGIFTGTYKCHTQVCHFKQNWLNLSFLAKYSIETDRKLFFHSTESGIVSEQSVSAITETTPKLLAHLRP